MSDHVRHYKGETCTVTIKNVPVHIAKLFSSLAEYYDTKSDHSAWLSKEYQAEEETQAFCAMTIQTGSEKFGSETLEERGVLIHDKSNPAQTFELIEPSGVWK